MHLVYRPNRRSGAELTHSRVRHAAHHRPVLRYVRLVLDLHGRLFDRQAHSRRVSMTLSKRATCSTVSAQKIPIQNLTFFSQTQMAMEDNGNLCLHRHLLVLHLRRVLAQGLGRHQGAQLLATKHHQVVEPHIIRPVLGLLCILPPLAN